MREKRAIINNDVITGESSGNCSGIAFPVNFAGVAHSLLRFDGQNIVDARLITDFFIDSMGVKHIVQHNIDWHSLKCGFDDKLIRNEISNKWRVKTQADELAETKANDNAKIQQDADNIANSSIHELLDYIASQTDAPQSLKDQNSNYHAKIAEKT